VDMDALPDILDRQAAPINSGNFMVTRKNITLGSVHLKLFFHVSASACLEDVYVHSYLPSQPYVLVLSGRWLQDSCCNKPMVRITPSVPTTVSARAGIITKVE
jgi:hypothetical protein